MVATQTELLADPSASLYVPRPLQAEIAAINARFRVANIHRRGGKTVFAVNWLIDGCVENPDWFSFFVSPFKTQSKANAWNFITLYAERHGAKCFKGDLIAEFPNGSAIQLLGAAEGWYATHRGRAANRIAMDEISQTSPDAWRSVFRPMLADTGGDALFIGTPQGEDYFAELYRMGLNPDMPNWGCITRDVTQTGIISDEEIQNLRDEMPEADFEREFMARFDVSPPGAFFGEQLKLATIEPAPHIPELPVYTSWFLNDTDAGTVIYWQDLKGKKRIFDTEHSLTTTTAELAASVLSRGFEYGRHYLAPNGVTDDARGRYGELRRAGVRLRRGESLPIIESIFATKTALPEIVINETLSDLVVALRTYHAEFDEKAKVFKARPEMDWTHGYSMAVSAFLTQYRTHTDWDKPLPLAEDSLHAA